jgi:hypothetical protein
MWLHKSAEPPYLPAVHDESSLQVKANAQLLTSNAAVEQLDNVGLSVFQRRILELRTTPAALLQSAVDFVLRYCHQSIQRRERRSYPAFSGTLRPFAFRAKFENEPFGLAPNVR